MKTQVATSAGFLLALCALVSGFGELLPTSRSVLAAHASLILAGGMGATSSPILEPREPDVASLGRGGRASDPGSTNSWRQFRGEKSNGISTRLDLPAQWGKNENYLWETKLPGRGSSSPVAHLQRVFVTSSSGYGESFEDRGDIRYLKHHVVCLDASTGEKIWHREIAGSQLNQELNHQLLNHGLASSTPATDGTNVYAFFGASGVFAFDIAGNLKWHADVGIEHSRYGSAASLVIHRDKLIVNASAESESVVALDLRDGRGLWRIEDVKNSWSTPVIGQNVDGESELIIQDDGRVRGFDPSTGDELWRFNGPEGYAASTPFVNKGVCFFTAGVTRTLTAFKTGGRGDVTETSKFWSVDNVSRHTSPLYLTGLVFANTESGVVKCFAANDGTSVNQQRLPSTNRVYGSLILAGCHLYIPTGGNRFFVCRANSKLDMIRDNEIDRSIEVKSTLCPSANSLLIRTDHSIHCVVETRRTKRVANVIQSTNENVVSFAPRFDLDVERNSSRIYNEFLSRHEEIRNRSILKSLEFEIDNQHRQETSKWIDEFSAGLDLLRTRQREAYWTYLRRRMPSKTELMLELVSVEQDTLELVEKIRLEIGVRLKSLGKDIATND